MSLAVVGGSALDVLFCGVKALPSWPEHTEFTRSNLALVAEAPLVTLGGNGANAAFVAAQRGARVTLYSVIGNDPTGQLLRGWLRRSGCRIKSPRGSELTPINVTAANQRQQRATLFFPGESIRLPRFEKPAYRDQRLEAVLVCGWPHPGLEEIAREFKNLQRRNVLTALDIGPILNRPWSLRAFKPVLQGLSLLLTNEYELQAITRSRGIRPAIRQLRRIYEGDVVIKRGARGVVWLPANSTGENHFPARRVQAVNTVGAGDAFNGALLAALLRRIAYPKAIQEANAVAATLVASRYGVLGVRARRRQS